MDPGPMPEIQGESHSYLFTPLGNLQQGVCVPPRRSFPYVWFVCLFVKQDCTKLYF